MGRKMRILNSLIVPKNVKGGTFEFFELPLCCKLFQFFGDIEKISKKSYNAEKTGRGPFVSPGIVCYAEKRNIFYG